MIEFYEAYRLQFDILGQVAVAMMLGASVGFDREMADKPAGLRTHILVAGAAALLVSLGDVMLERFSLEGNKTFIRADPFRLVGAVITGVSFLGAGTIIRRQSSHNVEGLTTAASLLFVATVGVTVALSQWVLAVALTVLLLVILRLLGFLSGWLWEQRHKPAGRDRQPDHDPATSA
jgi:putative Mg2+ transporter-C (MgtC) family protein